MEELTTLDRTHENYAGDDTLENEEEGEEREEQPLDEEEDDNGTIELSDTEHKANGKGRLLCKAKGCQKCTQQNCDGFCRAHFASSSGGGGGSTKKQRNGSPRSKGSPKRRGGCGNGWSKKSRKKKTPPVEESVDDEEESEEEEVEFISSSRRARTPTNRFNPSPSTFKRGRKRPPPPSNDDKEEESDGDNGESEEDDDDIWECHKCSTSNPTTKSRCGACLGWRGGSRSPRKQKESSAKGSSNNKKKRGKKTTPTPKKLRDDELSYSNNGRVQRSRKKPDSYKPPQDKPAHDKESDDDENEEKQLSEEDDDDENNGTIELSDTEDKKNDKGRGLCIAKGCLKCTQQGCDGFCRGHFVAASLVGAVKKKPKGGTKKKRPNAEEEEDEVIERPNKRARFYSSQLCRTDGCEKSRQSKCDGFCTAHFREQCKQKTTELKKEEKQGNARSKKSDKPSGKKGRKSSTSAASSADELKGDEDNQNGFQEGSKVLVKERKVGSRTKPGGVGTVTAVYSSGRGMRKYDVSYALGGEEHAVKEQHLSHCNSALWEKHTKSESESEDSDDDFSFSELELPETSAPTVGAAAPRRMLDEDLPLSYLSEEALLERTRYELLNGRDFWICTRCAIAMPSLTSPCGRCRRMISFVPLEVGEFEEFVRKQSQMNKEKADEWHLQWQRQVDELEEDDWSEEEEDTEEVSQHSTPRNS